MDLDDLEQMRTVDRSDTLSLLESASQRLTPPRNVEITFKEGLPKPENVVFAGVGGSGIVGDILSDYARGFLDVPVSVCRTLRLPSYVNEQTLFVAISYSGETYETLNLMAQARKNAAHIAAIGSGGKLLSEASSEGLPYVRVPTGLLPRFALPELLAGAVVVMERAELLKDARRLLSETSELVRVQIEKVKPSVRVEDNYAKRMAAALVDKIPLLIGPEENASVLRRFKNELNENSKMPAFYLTIPEAHHDDVEGLKALIALANIQPILLIDQDSVGAKLRTRDKLRSVLSELGFPPLLEFEGIGTDRLSQLLTAIIFGGYVSIYLAALRGVDPANLNLIPKFREATRGA